jgi:hypothetical protein
MGDRQPAASHHAVQVAAAGLQVVAAALHVAAAALQGHGAALMQVLEAVVAGAAVAAAAAKMPPVRTTGTEQQPSLLPDLQS